MPPLLYMDEAEERREARRRRIDLALDIGIPFVAAVATLVAMLVLAK
ncbi:MAG TPA: hypothetical protein VFP50_13965 [Anaeromyxobacteraceae bacterium]|nr:hypothetical protein [Anaeromyxobacteraceae bacterium]